MGWRRHSWIATKNSDAEDSELETIMGAPGADMETHTLFFDTEIRPFAQKMEDLLLLWWYVSVSSLYIAQCKSMCGFEKRDNYNKGAEGHKVPNCPAEKRELIMKAFEHFKMI